MTDVFLTHGTVVTTRTVVNPYIKEIRQLYTVGQEVQKCLQCSCALIRLCVTTNGDR